MRLSFEQTGDPAQVLQLQTVDPSKPSGREVVVRMKFAPINPADLNFIEGTYGRVPSLPAVPGTEGSGIVEQVGPEVKALQPGDPVIPLQAMGTWSRYVMANENLFAKLPEGVDPVQASMLRINPATAWQMLHHYRDLEHSDYIVQNAANSAVGQAVIQIAKHLGIRTINFVRRPELEPALKALGATHVLVDVDSAPAQAQEFIQNDTVKLALNAVGGDSAIRLMEVLSAGGAMVTYGAMSRRSLKVPNKFLIFKALELHGYWISRWMDNATYGEIYETLHPLAEMMRDGKLRLPVEKVYPLEAFHEAIQAAKQEGRSGKILFSFD